LSICAYSNHQSVRPQLVNPRALGCQEEPNGEGGQHAYDVTPIFDNNTAAGWVKAELELINPQLFCIIYTRQRAVGTPGTSTSIYGGCSYLCLDDILPPPAEDMIDNIKRN